MSSGDKAKDAKERADRDAENRAHAGHSYHTPDAGEMGTDDELSGLPWGSMSLKHVVAKGKAREEESRRGSKRDERSHYGDSSQYGGQYESREAQYDTQETIYDQPDAYYEAESTYYEEGDRAYYDYASGGSSR